MSFLWWLYYQLRRCIFLLFHRLSKCTRNVNLSLKPSTKFNHKIVVIGDDLAEGFGDVVGCFSNPGICGRLETMIKGDKLSGASRWIVVNRGISGSTSADWLPTVPNGLFQKVFSSSCPTFDSEIVIIMLGSYDLLSCCSHTEDNNDEHAETIASNIKQILNALNSKLIILCDVIHSTTTDTCNCYRSKGCAAKLNYLLSLCADDVNVAVFSLSNPRLNHNHYRNYLTHGNNHVTYPLLNKRGYSILARQLYVNQVSRLVRAVEWKAWKDILSENVVVDDEVDFDKKIDDKID